MGWPHNIHKHALPIGPLDFVTIILNVSNLEVYMALVDAEGADGTVAFERAVFLRNRGDVVTSNAVESSIDAVGDCASHHDVAYLTLKADGHVGATKVSGPLPSRLEVLSSLQRFQLSSHDGSKKARTCSGFPRGDCDCDCDCVMMVVVVGVDV